jgi:hypothetical protein
MKSKFPDDQLVFTFQQIQSKFFTFKSFMEIGFLVWAQKFSYLKNVKKFKI